MYSRTRCRVQASQRERSRLGTEVSSGPLFASAVGRRFELCSNLLSVVLMCGFSFMRLPTTSPTSCGRWRRRNTTLKEKLIKIGAKVVSHGRYIAFQMAEVAIPRQMFQEILRLIAELRPQPPPALA